jgi:hypothetical protein
LKTLNSPDVSKKYIADMITGFGVAEAVRHFYYIWWRCKGKKKRLFKALEM